MTPKGNRAIITTSTTQRDNEMTTLTLNQKIETVAKATNQTKAQVAAKLFAKDSWTHFLIGQA